MAFQEACAGLGRTNQSAEIQPLVVDRNKSPTAGAVTTDGAGLW